MVNSMIKGEVRNLSNVIDFHSSVTMNFSLPSTTAIAVAIPTTVNSTVNNNNSNCAALQSSSSSSVNSQPIIVKTVTISSKIKETLTKNLTKNKRNSLASDSSASIKSNCSKVAHQHNHHPHQQQQQQQQASQAANSLVQLIPKVSTQLTITSNSYDFSGYHRNNINTETVNYFEQTGSNLSSVPWNSVQTSSQILSNSYQYESFQSLPNDCIEANCQVTSSTGDMICPKICSPNLTSFRSLAHDLPRLNNTLICSNTTNNNNNNTNNNSNSSSSSSSSNNGTSRSSKPRRRVATMAQRKAANIRERRRMFHLNTAFDKLRKKVPTFAYEKRLSRIETLRLAVMYISFMTEVLKGAKDCQPRIPLHPSTGSFQNHQIDSTWDPSYLQK